MAFRTLVAIGLLGTAAALSPKSSFLSSKETETTPGSVVPEKMKEVKSISFGRLPALDLVDKLHIADKPCQRFVEVLDNQGNGAAYIGKVYVGGQKLDTIWDTGSDEIVINSMQTMNLASPCTDLFGNGLHNCYNKHKSKRYQALRAFPQTISYGSGNTVVLPGADHVNFVGDKCINPQVKFMELIETDIPQILQHDIDAVAGIGPKNWEKTTFLTQMGIERFSFCFMADQSKPGTLIWNDHAPEKHSEQFKFTTMPNNGADYWSIKATNFTLLKQGKENQVVGCQEGKNCFCVVDSGTSLITLDQDSLKAVEDHLNLFEKKTGMTCNEQNLKEFPIIKFNLEGKEHHFRPEDYLMYTEVDKLPSYVRGMLHFNSQIFPWLKEPSTKKECVMMFTPPMGNGLCILGMPFFRNYFVQFDRVGRTISTAPHDGYCKPKASSLLETETDESAETDAFTGKIQMIDVTKLRVSNAYFKLSKMSKNEVHTFLR